MGWPRVNGVRPLEIGTPGEMRQRLNALILAGTKRATAGLLVEYEREGEALEEAGEVLALVDDDTREIARVEVTRVEVARLDEVTWEFADSEGEGFTSVEDWRDGHRRFWTRVGETVDDDTAVVLVTFRLLGVGGPG